MLWPIVLPFQITCVLLFCLVIAATIFAPRWKRGRVPVAGWAMLLSFLAFIPACVGIQTVLDPFRFGEFQYADFESVGDGRVQRYLAGPATAITIQKEMGGFDAQFEIAKDSLDVWFEQYWDKYEAKAVGDRETPRRITAEQCEYQFNRKNWPVPNNKTEIWKYECPRGSNGAGSTIWFDATNRVAYQSAGYW